LHITSEGRASFSSEDVRILNLLADQAAVALGNARLYRDVAEREERVRALMQKLAHIQDEERRLIGLDLHDGLTQLVISAHMHLNTLNAMLAGLSDQAARRELETSRILVKRAIEEARRVIVELRPPMVADFGLAEGLRQYVNDVGAAEGWQSETRIALDGVALNSSAQAAIFRIAQEAIANARKHSGSPRIRVVLKADQNHLLLSVQDWGRGFDMAALADERDHLGLVSMSERAKMLGGQSTISTAPGCGATVSVRVPLVALR
jgi:signal transduction histidine kinase